MGESFVARASRQLLGDVDGLVADVAAAVQDAGLYGDSGVTAEDLRAAHRANLVGLLGFLSGEPQAGLAAPQETGRLRGGQGAPLPAVLRAYRLGASVIWDRLVAMAGDDAAARAELLSKASLAWQIFDEYTQAVTVSYQDAVAEHARRDAAIRDAALDALFGGQVAGGLLWDCATKLRLPQRGTFAVVVATLPDRAIENTFDPLPGIEAELTALGVRSAWRLQLGSQVGVVALTDTFGVQRLCTMIAGRGTAPVGISTPYDGLDDTHAALRQAQLACAAVGSADQRVLRYEDALVPALVASAPEVAGALAAAVLGPLLALPAADRDGLVETLNCWFAAGGEVAAVAEALYCHRNTVRSRLNRITEATGCDVATPVGAAHLYLAMQAHRINPMEPNPPEHRRTT
ncbi:helix-turn-helix domain-containing protein [Mycobacterium sp. M1]|uniref:Helix-turn-helix domain-containing protein n=1 Tax=Mycolicibacter acidiphilus TaxID=2835306 RepID=A0ABS5RNJ2_9MYCO|nr:helix-turn-helix domain-containing protein [Mycolicibacter acidiphilus]MBS9535873.1 helix-turn-helix domain-containing protein [Mycolicibacter acidiphilus]